MQYNGQNGHASTILGPNGLPWERSRNDQPRDHFGLPYADTFSSICSGAERTYWHGRYDEALSHLRSDALAMRNDEFLGGLMQERKLAVECLPWHLEIPDEKNEIQVRVRDIITKTIKDIEEIDRIVSALLEAIWYGRYGVQIKWHWSEMGGHRVLTVKDWSPVNGDKIGHSQDGTPYILVNGAEASTIPGACIITATVAKGLSLRGQWRQNFIIHKHEINDADFFEGWKADGRYGVGVRSPLFFPWWIRQELREWGTTYFERVGLGLTVWYYDGGNEKALAAVKHMATDQSRRQNLFCPIFTDGKGQNKGLIERHETPTGGADAIRGMIESLEKKMERYVVGQEASSSGKGSQGLGNEKGAEFQQETKGNITRRDARYAGTTLTGSELNPGLVWMIQRHSFPETLPGRPKGFRVRWVFDIEKQEGEKRLGAIKTLALDLRVKVKADEARSAAGCSKPAEGDEVIEPPQQGGPSGPGGDNPLAAMLGGGSGADELEGLLEGDDEPASYAADHPYRERLREASADVDPDPTPEQVKAGNYKMGHISIHGMDITIERPKGSIRKGVRKDGRKWKQKMAWNYGYIKQAISAADGDHCDVFVGPHPESEIVFVIDQLKPDGSFDEHKNCVGWYTAKEAKQGYLDCYSDDWTGFGAITPMTMADFKRWVFEGDTSKPVAVEEVVSYAAQHAPEGGVNVGGTFYPGGEFIPGDVVASASAEEKSAIEGKGGGFDPSKPYSGHALDKKSFDAHVGQWQQHIAKHYGEWSASVSPETAKAVASYEAHPWINKFLRSGQLPDDKEIKSYSWVTGDNSRKTAKDAGRQIKSLDAAIASTPPTPSAMEVHRFIGNEGSGADLYQKIANGEVKEGSTLTDAGYQSTSYGRSVADPSRISTVVMKINVPKGSHALPTEAIIKGKQGEDQREFILPRNAKYTVTKIENVGTSKVVHVDYTEGEIPEGKPEARGIFEVLKGMFGYEAEPSDHSDPILAYSRSYTIPAALTDSDVAAYRGEEVELTRYVNETVAGLEEHFGNVLAELKDAGAPESDLADVRRELVKQKAVVAKAGADYLAAYEETKERSAPIGISLPERMANGPLRYSKTAHPERIDAEAVLVSMSPATVRIVEPAREVPMELVTEAILDGDGNIVGKVERMREVKP